MDINSGLQSIERFIFFEIRFLLYCFFSSLDVFTHCGKPSLVSAEHCRVFAIEFAVLSQS